ncbi:MAG: VanZ family protein [Lachnospiraceae bacterium]|nr:VanZ family protein [Lachnospiraceae bacterium]
MIMIRFLGIGMDCISSMLMLAPAALLILKLSGRRLKNKHMFFLLLYLCVLTGIYSVTGIPDIKDCSFDFTLNLIPLVDVLSSPDQYLLNILMFLPVGFLLPLLWDEYQDFRHLMGFCCFLTVFIEVAQVFTFRTTDVDDLLTNLLGAALGYALIHLPAKRWNIRLPLNIDNDYEEKHGQWVYLLVLFLQQFFVQPYWSAFFWDTLL